MNLILERVNAVCNSVRQISKTPITFRKLISTTRKEFKNYEIDLVLKVKKDNTLSNDSFYVAAFYDPIDDFNNETPIEVLVYHNFSLKDCFHETQITELLIQIYDAVVHELKHQQQSRKRHYETYSDHAQEPFSKYLADPDELDAYALSIAIELLRVIPLYRANKYMTRMAVLSKLKHSTMLVSPNLRAYVQHFNNNPLLKKLAKKVYKHLNSLDKDQIFR
jgi:hypothetical protein